MFKERIVGEKMYLVKNAYMSYAQFSYFNILKYRPNLGLFRLGSYCQP